MPLTESHKDLHRFGVWQYRPHLSGLSSLYLNTVFLTFCFSIMELFVPIYVYQITHDLSQTILFFIIWEASHLAASFPSAWFISHFGPDKSILLGALLRTAYILTLMLSAQFPWLLWPTAILSGIKLPPHWLSYHLAFDRQTTPQKVGSQVSFVYIITQIAAALSPLLGGIIASIWGFSSLYLVALIFLVASILPIFLDQYDEHPAWPGFKKILVGRRKGGITHFSWAFFGFGMEAAVYSWLWPLFLFLILGNMKQIGLIQTTSLILSILVAQVIKNKALPKTRRFVSLSSAANSFNWAIKPLLLTPLFLALSDIAYLITNVFTRIPFDSSTYWLPKKNPLIFFTNREIATHSGGLVILLAALLLVRLNFSLAATLIGGIIGLNLVLYWANHSSSLDYQETRTNRHSI